MSGKYVRGKTTSRVVKVIENYWDCPYCNTTHIPGLEDFCPGCGVHKPDDTKYKLDRANAREVTEELAAKYDKTVENLMKLPDWKCEHCNSLNDAEDASCETCGSPRYSAEEDYFGRKINERPDYETDYFDKNEGYVESKAEREETGAVEKEIKSDYKYHKPYDYTPSYEGLSYKDTDKSGKNNYQNWYSKFDYSWLAFIGKWSILFGIIAVVTFLFWPIKEKTLVNGFQWSRTIVIEEERTFKESGWSTPVGARVYRTNKEIHHYEDVIDHYETEQVAKTQQVYSHDEVSYDEIDNGNGTTTVIENKTPVYELETYYDDEQVPVYRKEPVYKTKYYYEIDRYVDIFESKSSGKDKKAYWNEDYTLGYKQRDTERYENYIVLYDNGDRLNLKYAEWQNTKLGEAVVITKNRLGLVYKQEKAYTNTDL